MPDSIPMPWLGRPGNTDIAGQTIGGVIGGALRAARPSVRQGRSYLETLPQGIEEGIGLAQDPQYTLKKAQVQAQIVNIGAQYQNTLLDTQLKTKLIGQQSADQQFLSRLTTDAGGDPDKLLTGLTQFVPQSPQGLQASTQLRLAASQSLARKTTTQNNAAILKKAQTLSPEDWSTFMSYSKNEDGSFSPDAIQFLGSKSAPAKPLSALGQLMFDREEARKLGRMEDVAQYDLKINQERNAERDIQPKQISFEIDGKTINALYNPQTGSTQIIRDTEASKDQDRIQREADLINRKIVEKESEVAGMKATPTGMLGSGGPNKKKLAIAEAELAELKKQRDALGATAPQQTPKVRVFDFEGGQLIEK